MFKSDQDLLKDYYIKCSWPVTYYANLVSLANLTNGKRILEIGVAYGYHAEHILSNISNCFYVGVDPYKAHYDSKDPFVRDVSELFNDHAQAAMDRLYHAVNSTLSDKFKHQFKLIRNNSLDALEDFENESFDVIFIDGDHRYESVAEELRSYWPILARGGILAGDDYDWPDVARAVEEFASVNSLNISYLSQTSRGYPTYFFQKP